MIKTPHNQSGFTIIEFIIVSLLSIIIAFTIGALYIQSNRLQDSTDNQIEKLDDIQGISSLISQDAYLSGNFACLNLNSAYHNTFNNNNNKLNDLFNVKFHSSVDMNSLIYFNVPNSSPIDTSHQHFGVNYLDSNLLNIRGFIPKGKALIYYYGTGSSHIINSSSKASIFNSITFDLDEEIQETIEKGGYLALSSCQSLNIFKSDSSSELKFHNNGKDEVEVPLIENIDDHHIAELNLLKLNIVIYVIGRIEKDSKNDGLYRIELADDGSWSSPVLLSENVTQISAKFIYSSLIKNNYCYKTAEKNKDFFITKDAPLYEQSHNKGNSHNTVYLAPTGMELEFIFSKSSSNRRSVKNTSTLNNKDSTLKIIAAFSGGQSCNSAISIE